MSKTPEITEAIKALRAIDAVETARAREAIKAIKAIKAAGAARTLDAIKALRASKDAGAAKVTAPAAKAPKTPKAPKPSESTTQIKKPARVVDRLLTQLGSCKRPISAAELAESLQCSMASVSLALRDLQAQGVVVKARTGRQIQYTLA
jgi:biotin operon repressor